jgi:predicted Rossmann fold flavoprotein
VDAEVVVSGGGAAGLMGAALAARRGRRVVVVEHWKRIGERIRISGGGRCNFTNRRVTPEHYLSENPHFCRSALARFTPADFVELLERRGVPYEERDHGQLFCRRAAADVTAALRAEMDDAGAGWLAPCAVDRVERISSAPDGCRFLVSTDRGALACASVVIATGGLAAPQIGATPFGYEVARRFGLRIIGPVPALVPLSLGAETFGPLRSLAGVAFEAEASCARHPELPAFRERALVTHQGLSGPAILQVSSYWQQLARSAGSSAKVVIDLLPGCDAEAWLASERHGRRTLLAALAERVPRRLAEAIVRQHSWPMALAEASNRTIASVARALKDWTVAPAGTLGFAKAEVTLGGVDTAELSSKTMEARKVPGLYFVGEVVDVTGWLGGYNFQWAWSSGWVAGQYA